MGYVADIVLKVLTKHEDHVVEPTDLWAETGTDDLDRLQALFDLQDVFDIELSDEDVERIRTVQNLIDLVNSKVGVQL